MNPLIVRRAMNEILHQRQMQKLKADYENRLAMENLLDKHTHPSLNDPSLWAQGGQETTNEIVSEGGGGCLEGLLNLFGG